jgi:hypothetical protein
MAQLRSVVAPVVMLVIVPAMVIDDAQQGL